jgi:Mg2+ and Co2+ transporter CorA
MSFVHIKKNYLPKKIYSYQKGNILTLLKQSYDDLSKDEAKLLEAIIDAVNSANNQISHNNSNLDDINDFISSCIDIKGIISFSSAPQWC